MILQELHEREDGEAKRIWERTDEIYGKYGKTEESGRRVDKGRKADHRSLLAVGKQVWSEQADHF